MVFTAAKVAVYIDGCFWHSCPEHGTQPKANGQWWSAKLERNRERDADTDVSLVSAGWLPVRIWEHEDPAVAARDIARAVRSRRAQPKRPRP